MRGKEVSTGITRRDFLRAAAVGSLVAAMSPGLGYTELAQPRTPGGRAKPQTRLPRWRGFNLQEMLTTKSEGRWREDDFLWMRDWGFDFVRLPLCYTLWIENDDPYRLYEPGLAKVDAAVELGRKYGIHVNVAFHRGPGYSVNEERKEPYNLWKDQAGLDAFCFHWTAFAKRYKGISPSELSFNLINEPAAAVAEMTRGDHERVIRTTVAAIRRVDPERLIIADGVDWGTVPCSELADLGIAQSSRFYTPHTLTHYAGAGAVEGQPGKAWPEPVWPGHQEWGRTWDRKALEQHYRPWAELAAQGIGVHCGEGGAYRPRHGVILAWLRDVMEILKSHNIGYALWRFRGPCGILDSEADDVDYEDFHGHKLDRKLLALLQEF